MYRPERSGSAWWRHRLPSAFFVTTDADGRPRGVTVDLGLALGKQLGVPVEFVIAPNSGVITDATASAAIDVTFMPVDEERRKRVAFGPNYVVIESTFMATAASGAKSVAEVDRAGMRVIGIANTTTIRAAARTLKNTTISPVTSVDDAMKALRDGKADAFALSRDSLPVYVKQIAGIVHRRRRVSTDRHRDRHPAEQTGRARLCHRVHGRRQAQWSWCAARSMPRASTTSPSLRRSRLQPSAPAQ